MSEKNNSTDMDMRNIASQYWGTDKTSTLPTSPFQIIVDSSSDVKDVDKVLRKAAIELISFGEYDYAIGLIDTLKLREKETSND